MITTAFPGKRYRRYINSLFPKRRVLASNNQKGYIRREFLIMNIAAIYARVSSDKQKEEQTIGSQVAALKEYAGMHGHTVPPEWIFLDEGYSGATLQRPGLEQLRDVAAEGRIDKVLVIFSRPAEP